jgi:hypothetical protein
MLGRQAKLKQQIQDSGLEQFGFDFVSSSVFSVYAAYTAAYQLTLEYLGRHRFGGPAAEFECASQAVPNMQADHLYA